MFIKGRLAFCRHLCELPDVFNAFPTCITTSWLPLGSFSPIISVYFSLLLNFHFCWQGRLISEGRIHMIWRYVFWWALLKNLVVQILTSVADEEGGEGVVVGNFLEIEYSPNCQVLIGLKGILWPIIEFLPETGFPQKAITNSRERQITISQMRKKHDEC